MGSAVYVSWLQPALFCMRTVQAFWSCAPVPLGFKWCQVGAALPTHTDLCASGVDNVVAHLAYFLEAMFMQYGGQSRLIIGLGNDVLNSFH